MFSLVVWVWFFFLILFFLIFEFVTFLEVCQTLNDLFSLDRMLFAVECNQFSP